MNRFRSRIALVSVPALMLILASGCGMDPPATGTTPAATAGGDSGVAAPAIQGIKPTPAESLSPVAESSASVRCNIETIAGANLEGVRPAVNTRATVGIAGWYFAGASTPATADAATTAVDASDTATASPAEAAAADAGDIQLVISNEDASRNWIVQVPARTERPDVADHLKEPAALQSGFAFDLDLSELTAGSYNMHLSDAAHSAGSVCGLGRGFVVE